MTTYFIEPGNWEAATGECLPKESDGITVVPVAELQKSLQDAWRLRKALENIVRRHAILVKEFARLSDIALIAQRALNQEEACDDLK